MSDYTDDINDAYDDILAAGIAATITRVASTYDPVAETETITAVTTDTTAVVTVPASSEMLKPYDNGFIEDYRKGRNRFFLVAAKSMTFEPEPGDLLYFNSRVWEIAGTTPLNPNGSQPIIYTMGVKASNLSALPVVP